MFLRNLCRVVRLPVFVSGTDSHVANMIGGPGSFFGSRVEEDETRRWVNVNVKTSKAALKSFAKLVKFKKCSKKDPIGCLTPYISNGPNVLKYTSLLKDVYGRDPKLNELSLFKKIAEFLIQQAKTSLPGVISLVFSRLLELVSTSSDDKILWSKLTESFTLNISNRKYGLKTKNGLFASSHILIFPSIVEDGNYSANLVENHLFYYGARNDVTFQLDLQYENENVAANQTALKGVLMRNGVKYIDKCNFPELHEDFFTTFACLNVWNYAVIKEGKEGKKRWTMACLYEEYLRTRLNFNIEVDKTVQKSFYFELLSYWSICCASHQNFNGKNAGVDVFWEFVKNLQRSKDSEGNIQRIKFTNSDPLNDNLNAILKKVEVPYLLRFPADDNESNSLKAFLNDFMVTGECHFPLDAFGWDVAFTMKFNGIPKDGLIECKYHDKAIGFAGFIKYYKKQCESNDIPLAFFICRKLGKQILPNFDETIKKRKTSKKEGKLAENKVQEDEKGALEEEELYESDSDTENNKAGTKAKNNNNAPKKRKFVKTDYFELLTDLWKDSKNHIDIYTVRYNQISKELPQNGPNKPNETTIVEVEGKFIVSALKTFPKPKGAFILIESNFTSPAQTEKS